MAKNITLEIAGVKIACDEATALRLLAQIGQAQPANKKAGVILRKGNAPVMQEQVVTRLSDLPKDLTPEDFVLSSIRENMKKGFKGLHVVFGGLNQEFNRRFASPAKETIDLMLETGLIKGHFSKGGFTIYLP